MRYLTPTCCYLVLLTAALVLVGCDSVESGEEMPDPYAEMEIGAPLNTAIEGEATLGDGTSFSEQGAFFFPIGNSGSTLTAILLFGEDDTGASHSLSFTYIGEEPLGEGDYDLGFDALCDPPSDCRRPGLVFGDRLMSSYTRATDDSLYSYMPTGGTLTVEQASEEGVVGAFTVEAGTEASVSIADIEAFIDELRNNPPTGNDPRELPELPPHTVTPLETPLTIEGDFAATPGALPDRPGNRFSWMVQGGVFGMGR
jgi:hypothetical protein